MSVSERASFFGGIVLLTSLVVAPVSPASAQMLSIAPFGPSGQIAAPESMPPDDANIGDANVGVDELAPQLQRQVVSYSGSEPAGTIIIDTTHAFLYLTLGDGRAIRYGIGVGRQGFTWSGIERISRKAEWPDWIPPAEMIARQPYLPRWVGGGPGNPLGARALYLGNTDYRIHGTNDPTSIGKHMSSGCIRMLNADVIDLYNRVGIGTKVVVLPNGRQNNVLIETGRDGRVTARIVAPPSNDRGVSRSASRTDVALPAIY